MNFGGQEIISTCVLNDEESIQRKGNNTTRAIPTTMR
jgi:hypothetical protein